MAEQPRRITDHTSADAKQRRSLFGIDLFNFFLADVQTGVGPFLAVYLTTRGWDARWVGLALTAAGLADLLVQIPAGALVDRLRQRRELLGLSVLTITVAALIIAIHPTTAWVMAANAMLGSTASLIGPGITAISLGIVGYAGLARRQGRNRSWNSAGNLFAGVSMGLAGWLLTPASIFWIVAVFTLPTLWSLAMIDPTTIDDDLARGRERGKPSPGGLRFLVHDRALIVFAVGGMLFSFANAAMLPLLGERLALLAPARSAVAMGAIMVTTQLIIALVSPAAARWAQRWGRRPLLLIAFSCLVLRAVLCALTHHPLLFISYQILDGIGAALIGVAALLVIADRTRGTAHFNLTQGVLATLGGMGAAASQTIAGSIVHQHGYPVAFTLLAAVAACGLIGIAVALPETAPPAPRHGGHSGAGPHAISGRPSAGVSS